MDIRLLNLVVKLRWEVRKCLKLLVRLQQSSQGKRIFAFKICIQIDSVDLDYMWASRIKKFSIIISAASTESLFKIYLITNVTT